MMELKELHMDIWTATSFDTVFLDDQKPAASESRIQWIAARNEYESAQIVLRSSLPFTITDVHFSDLKDENDSIPKEYLRYRFLDYVYLDSNTPDLKNSVREGEGYYPEQLSNDRSRTVAAGTTQSIWVTLYVPKGINPGQYVGTATVQTADRTYACPITLEVCKPTLPDTRHGALTISYWSWNAGRMMSADDEDQILIQYGYERYSESWWQLMERFADSWREHRMNELLVHHQTLLLDGGTTMDEAGRYSFNWSRFDEVLQFFIDRDCIRSFTGTRLLFPPEKDADYEAYMLLRNSEGTMIRTLVPLDNEEAANWWQQYLPALKEHLMERGWFSLWRQQIGDEPHTDSQRDQWLYIRGLIDDYASGIRIGDAFSDSSFVQSFAGRTDVWVAQLDVYQMNRNFFDERRTAHEEVWLYTCSLPKGDYLNRFLDQPAWSGRLLLWLVYNWGLTGYLHWGWNIWQFGLDAYESRGDAYIVWPDPANKTIKESIRSEAVRDGAEEYELLHLLAEQHPERAANIAASIAASGTNYVNDPRLMTQARIDLLRAFDEWED